MAGLIMKSFKRFIQPVEGLSEVSNSQLDPSIKYVYTGLPLKLKDALEIVKGNALSKTIKIGKTVMVGYEYKYTPKQADEDWSSREYIALHFAIAHSPDMRYSLSIFHIKRYFDELKQLIYKQQNLKSIPKGRDDVDRYSLESAKSSIGYKIQEEINTYLSSASNIPMVVQIIPDKYCVMNPLFSNKVGVSLGIGSEYEVTRSGKVSVAATIWIPEAVITGAKMIAEVQEFIKKMKKKQA